MSVAINKSGTETYSHILQDYNDSDVGDSYKVKKFRLHEDYDELQLHNDIMLIELEDAVDEKYDVMSLNNGSVFDLESYSGSAVATGWGAVEFLGELSTHLLETSLPLLSPQSCDDYLNSEDRLNPLLISSYDSRGKVCAGGDGTTDTCQGDRYVRFDSCCDLTCITNVINFGNIFCVQRWANLLCQHDRFSFSSIFAIRYCFFW